jgi:hypothetical protein
MARSAALARLISERLERARRRLELAGLEPGDDLAHERARLARLLGVEHGVHRREVLIAVEELDVDGVELAPGDVRILGDADADANGAPVRKRRRRLDRLPAQTHAVGILARGAG